MKQLADLLYSSAQNMSRDIAINTKKYVNTMKM